MGGANDPMTTKTYLCHYGIPGMKWGQRKAKKESKIKAQRKKDYANMKIKAKKNKEWADNNTKEINDLKKNGIKSKTFKKTYGNISSKQLNELYGYGHKDALKTEIDLRSRQRDSFLEDSKNFNKIAQEVKNTPLNKKTSVDIARRNTKISKGINIAGTVLGTAGSIALGVATKSPKVAIGTAVASGMLGSIATYTAFPTRETAIYEKRNKS